MKIAIYGNNLKGAREKYVPWVFDALKKYDPELYFHRDFFDFLEEAGMCDIACHEVFGSELPQGVDYLITLGGDGTILRAAELVYRQDVPIVGVNLGRLGFLASISPDELATSFDILFSGKMNFERKMLLQVECHAALERCIAVNEVVVSRKDTSSMISIEVWVDGKFLNIYWVDGLIISTPTGSTGYSLSCAGPIISPDSENIVLTPIAPHNLNVRPIILRDNVKVLLKVSGRECQYLLSLDSRFAALDQQLTVSVSKSDHSLRIASLPDSNFFERLRLKLGWGKDKRN